MLFLREGVVRFREDRTTRFPSVPEIVVSHAPIMSSNPDINRDSRIRSGRVRSRLHRCCGRPDRSNDAATVPLDLGLHQPGTEHRSYSPGRQHATAAGR